MANAGSSQLRSEECLRRKRFAYPALLVVLAAILALAWPYLHQFVHTRLEKRRWSACGAVAADVQVVLEPFFTMPERLSRAKSRVASRTAFVDVAISTTPRPPTFTEKWDTAWARDRWESDAYR